MLDQQSAKLYYSSNSGGATADLASRNLHTTDASESSQVQWTPWEHDGALTDSQVHMPLVPGQLSFLDSKLNGSNGDHFESSGDSIRIDKGMPLEHNLQDLIIPIAPAISSMHGASYLAESPHGSGLSKENSDREVKQELRADSSDCSDPMEDDDDKAASRTGRRHLSKNLVAERKRRKKLNERLYSLRALVPKITKMDRASILGDAIEYVKELQQQVKALQDELLEVKEEEVHPAGALAALQEGGGVDGNAFPSDEARLLVAGRGEDAALERKADDLTQPMQVEVSKVDGQTFTLRIFCEKRPGVFVKLMQALDVLGLDILHANITTFRGLVLNVFNAEIKDKDLMRVEQVKETLLEMTSQSGAHC